MRVNKQNWTVDFNRDEYLDRYVLKITKRINERIQIRQHFFEYTPGHNYISTTNEILEKIEYLLNTFDK